MLLSGDFIGYACNTLQWASTFFHIYVQTIQTPTGSCL